MNATKVIRRERFRAPPPAVADLLRSLATYQPVSGWPRDCRRLADILADAEPHKTLRELMRTAQTVSAVKEADWTGIREIRISRPVDEDAGILSKAKMQNRLRNVTKYVTL